MPFPAAAVRSWPSPWLSVARAGAGGLVPVRQARWVRHIGEQVAGAALRADHERNVLRVAWTVAGYAAWDGPPLSRPTWARMVEQTGLSRRTVARHLRWLEERGLLFVAETGSSPAVRGVLAAGGDNRAAVYLLTARRPVDENGTPTDSRSEARYPRARDGSENVPCGPAPPGSPPRDSAGTGPRWAGRRPGRVPGLPAAGPLPPAPRPTGRKRREDEEQPAGRAGQRRRRRVAAAQLRAQVPLLGRVSTPYVASLIRAQILAGWSVDDVRWALDHRPDGSRYGHTHAVRSVPGWCRARLAAWTDAGVPVPGRRGQLEAAAAGHRVYLAPAPLPDGARAGQSAGAARARAALHSVTERGLR